MVRFCHVIPEARESKSLIWYVSGAVRDLRRHAGSCVGNISRYLRYLMWIPVYAVMTWDVHAETELTGFVALEERWFMRDAQMPGQNSGRVPTVIIEPELYHVSDDGKNTLVLRPFARFDSNDPRRMHWDIRQADWLYSDNEWELRAGISKVFWGVIESNHLVDIVNQTDFIEDTDLEDKLGQPLVQSSWFSDYGTIRLLYMPYFRERSFSGTKGRLRAVLPVAQGLAGYESGMERWHPDVALRYTKVLDEWDIGLAHFYGTSREPRIVNAVDSSGMAVLRPFYDVINQTGIDLQYTTDGGWLWKLEALTRDGHVNSDRFYAIAAGFEYTLYQIMESDADLGLIAELHRDTRGQYDPATLFDDDIFIGGRITMNDVNDTAFLGGVVIDRKNHSRFFNLEFERRIGDRYKLEADMRIFSNLPSGDPFSYIGSEDFFQLRLARYF